MSVGIDSVRTFYDGYLDKLTTTNSRHMWVFKSFEKLLPKHCNVLDIGCGTGITSKNLAYNARNVTAIDLSPVLIEYAKTYNSHFNAVKYIVGDIADFKSEEKFDVITMVDVLEHILPESMSKVFQVLKNVSHNNTRIYLNIPSGDLLDWLWKNKPDNRQIVDTPYSHAQIIEWFSRIDFIPAYYQLYWQQYVEYLFITKKSYDKTFKGVFCNG